MHPWDEVAVAIRDLIEQDHDLVERIRGLLREADFADDEIPVFGLRDDIGLQMACMGVSPEKTIVPTGTVWGCPIPIDPSG